MANVIDVKNLSKSYRVSVREPGLTASLKSLFSKQFRMVEAVKGVGFQIKQGEMVGFIGPNGAGKTTTLKMLAGLLYPTSGTANVLGFVPWKRQPEYLSRISMVLGNKSQMLWDIPPLDTFEVLRQIYRVPQKHYQETLDELVDLLDMVDLLKKPVRNFSLGERMKCELVAGLLHQPEVMFLDEPTLGLDVSMQNRLRKFLREYNSRNGVTVMLTSHYMADVMALSSRVILIHKGILLYDGNLQGLSDRLAPFKLIKITLANDMTTSKIDRDLLLGYEVLENENNKITIRTNREDTPIVTSEILNNLPVVDLSVENPPIEAVIDQIYQGGEI